MSREGEIQKAIINYLQFKESLGELTFQRTNNVGLYDPKKKTFRSVPKGMKLGFPDIVVVKEGQFIGLEVKSDEQYKQVKTIKEKGKWKKVQSQHQVKYEKLVKSCGGQYYVVRSVNDVVEALGGNDEV